MPMMATTIISSIRVNPCGFVVFGCMIKFLWAIVILGYKLMRLRFKLTGVNIAGMNG